MMQDKPQEMAPKPPEPEPDHDLTAAERDEAQTLRQAPDNANPGEAAGS
jgi:hypothetical protein